VRYKVSLIAMLLLSTVVAACAGGKPIDVNDSATTGTATPTPSGSPTSTAPKFSTDVFPLFASKGCNGSTGCHQGASPVGIVNLGGTGTTAAAAFTSITTTSNVVITGTPANSLLLKKPLTGDPTTHSGGKQFTGTTDPAYVTILDWITAGAQNN